MADNKDDFLQWRRLHSADGGGKLGTLIVTRDTPEGGTSSQDIERVIREAVLG